MTSDLQTQLFAIWLPLFITLLLGMIGLLRGAVREAILAAWVAIAALVITQWGAQWGQTLHDLYNGWPQEGEQFYLSLAVLWAVALILGYGVGALLPRQPLNAQSRAVGLMLGLFSGAALVGWSLRLSITNTDDKLQPGVLLDTAVSRGFIIWTTWFPLVLVLLGTILVLVGPLRRAQGAVGQPATTTDWTPTAATTAAARTPVGAPMASGYTPTGTAVLGYAAARQVSSSVSPSAPGATTQAQVPVSPFVPPTAPVTSAYDTYGNYDSTRTRAFTPQPEPPTTLLPSQEVSSGSTTGTSAENGVRTSEPSPWAGPQSRETAAYSTFDSATTDDSSWLLQAVDSSNQEDGASAEAVDAQQSSAATETNEPPASAVETIVPASAPEEPQTETPVTLVQEAPAERTCPNCGSSVLSGASFCTTCGTRIAQ